MLYIILIKTPFVSMAIIIDQDSYFTIISIFKFAFLNLSIVQSHFAITMWYFIFPLTFVFIPICIGYNAKTIFPVLIEVTLIYVSFRVYMHSLFILYHCLKCNFFTFSTFISNPSLSNLITERILPLIFVSILINFNSKSMFFTVLPLSFIVSTMLFNLSTFTML